MAGNNGQGGTINITSQKLNMAPGTGANKHPLTGNTATEYDAERARKPSGESPLAKAP